MDSAVHLSYKEPWKFCEKVYVELYNVAVRIDHGIIVVYILMNNCSQNHFNSQAAPGYTTAKEIIKLINCVAKGT